MNHWILHWIFLVQMCVKTSEALPNLDFAAPIYSNTWPVVSIVIPLHWVLRAQSLEGRFWWSLYTFLNLNGMASLYLDRSCCYSFRVAAVSRLRQRQVLFRFHLLWGAWGAENTRLILGVAKIMTCPKMDHFIILGLCDFWCSFIFFVNMSIDFCWIVMCLSRVFHVSCMEFGWNFRILVFFSFFPRAFPALPNSQATERSGEAGRRAQDREKAGWIVDDRSFIGWYLLAMYDL